MLFIAHHVYTYVICRRHVYV